MTDAIYFVTTNKRKYEEYKELVEAQGVVLEQCDAELIEPQTTDEMFIIEHKLEQAKKMFPGKRVLVDDRGFNIPALNGFPGPMVKLTLKTIGVDGFIRLMQGKSDRRAEFVTSLGYFDGRDDSFFQTKEEGFLLETSKGNNLRGWNELLYIYGYKSNPGRSLAEYTDAEWDAYLIELNDGDAMKQFLCHL
ncbi:MAG TPA: non-canonical purine NTP pyrophosphatase [Candidatus Saccharimonadales bacterium]